MSAGPWRPAPARLIPWGNGAGESRELLTGPGWRVSTTWIERDCEFSHYPGKQRRIVLMQGAGFRLDFAGHPGAALSKPGDSAGFLGAWRTACTLASGRVEVLNLILDEAFAPPTLDSLGSGELRLGRHAAAIFCAAGSATAGGFDLRAGDLLAAAPGTPVHVRMAPGALLLEIGLPG